MIETLKRIAVSLIGIPIILGSIYYGELYLFIVVSIIALISQNEFYNISGDDRIRISRIPGLLSGFAILYLYYLNLMDYILPLLLLVTLIIIISELFSEHALPLLNASLSIMGIIYPTLLIGTLYPLRHIDYLGTPGLNLVIALLAGVWLCDTAAYFIGKSFGKHKLIERISPNKTWEGSIAGFVAAATVIFLFKQNGFLGSAFSTVDLVALSIIAGVSGQIGDLFESMLKRGADLKDSGVLLPGHGGFLDRFDALIFAAPLAYVYFVYL